MQTVIQFIIRVLKLLCWSVCSIHNQMKQAIMVCSDTYTFL